MGQEEVSVIRKSFEDNGNLFLNENREKDIQISRKEFVMKTNGKKRIFALLMCAMMIISSMSVWAAYATRTIGGDRPNEQAICELYLTSSKGQAFTTPNSSAMAATTNIVVEDANGNTKWGYGSTSATVTKSNLVGAGSNHYAGPYSISIGLAL